MTVDECFRGQEKARGVFDAVHKKIRAMGNVRDVDNQVVRWLKLAWEAAG